MVIRLLALLSGVAPFPADGGEFAFLVIVVDPSSFLPPGEFERGAAGVRRGIRATPPAPGFCAVRMPSDRSIQVRAQRRRDGIEIDRAVYERLDSIRRSGPGAELRLSIPGRPVRREGDAEKTIAASSDPWKPSTGSFR